jgi:hypothetical protein
VKRFGNFTFVDLTDDETEALTDDDLTEIPHYAFDYGRGGFEGRLLIAFARELGDNLGRDECAPQSLNARRFRQPRAAPRRSQMEPRGRALPRSASALSACRSS